MKIALDVSPLKEGHYKQHKVRGSGFYVENLKNALLKYFPDNEYIFFTQLAELKKDIDIVHFPYFEPFFLTLPSKNNYKTVVTVHDLTPLVFSSHFPFGVKGKIKWYIQKYLLSKADAIITDSESSKIDIKKYVKIQEDKIDVVYLAAGEQYRIIKNNITLAKCRKKYNLPDNFALYVGDVTWNKNLPRLVRAVQKAGVNLVMVGKALTQKEFDRTNLWTQDLIKIQELVKNDNKIISLGFVPSEDLVSLYNLATIFIMPSIYEGFGLPILEAMSCGCPVVTTKQASIPEVGGEAALYVDAYSEDSIVYGIKKAYFNESLQKELSKKGINQATNFSWKKTAYETIKIYEKTHS